MRALLELPTPRPTSGSRSRSTSIPDETPTSRPLREHGWTLARPGSRRRNAGRLRSVRPGLQGRDRHRQERLRRSRAAAGSATAARATSPRAGRWSRRTPASAAAADRATGCSPSTASRRRSTRSMRCVPLRASPASRSRGSPRSTSTPTACCAGSSPRSVQHEPRAPRLQPVPEVLRELHRAQVPRSVAPGMGRAGRLQPERRRAMGSLRPGPPEGRLPRHVHVIERFEVSRRTSARDRPLRVRAPRPWRGTQRGARAQRASSRASAATTSTRTASTIPSSSSELWETRRRAARPARRAVRPCGARGCPPGLPHVEIAPAVDAAFFPDRGSGTRPGRPSRPLRMLSVGRLHWMKGYPTALHAVALLRERGVACEYRIAGAADYGEGRSRPSSRSTTTGSRTTCSCSGRSRSRTSRSSSPGPTSSFTGPCPRASATQRSRHRRWEFPSSAARRSPRTCSTGRLASSHRLRDPDGLAAGLERIAADPSCVAVSARRDARGRARTSVWTADREVLRAGTGRCSPSRPGRLGARAIRIRLRQARTSCSELEFERERLAATSSAARAPRRWKPSCEEFVPDDDSVLVVSRGDSSLLEVGRPASHFPQAADGAYLGHHPRPASRRSRNSKRSVNAGPQSSSSRARRSGGSTTTGDSEITSSIATRCSCSRGARVRCLSCDPPASARCRRGAGCKEARRMSRPKLSVLVNNFNYADFVGAAIESALDEGPDVEVIVVDDGSTDHSRDVIEASATASSRSSRRTRPSCRIQHRLRGFERRDRHVPRRRRPPRPGRRAVIGGAFDVRRSRSSTGRSSEIDREGRRRVRSGRRR